MKNQLRLRSIVFLLIISCSFYSCQDDNVSIDTPKDEGVGLNENFEKIEQFLSLKNNLNDLKVMKGSTSRFGSENHYKVNTPSNGRVSEDSLGISEEEFWISCAEVTEIENLDGSYTITVDYGDGCEEGNEDFKIFMFGKYTETGQFFEDSSEVSIGGGTLEKGLFEGFTIYENFGSEIEDWRNTMSGQSQYSNSFEYFFSESEGVYKIIDNNSYQDALTIENSSEDFFEVANVTSNYEEVFEMIEGSEPTITINKADYDYTSEENSFSSRVIQPLLLKFECDSENIEDYTIVYISGVEEITYDDETFTIDYGNGECDNLVTITDSEGNIETYNMATGEVE